MYQIEIYEDIHGKSSVIDYFKKLQKSSSKEDRIKIQKITMYMRLLKEYGLSLNEPYIKHLEEDIWELRPLKDRFLFAYWKSNRFIILNHFTKKTNKTPKNEIEKARKLLRELKSRGDLE